MPVLSDSEIYELISCAKIVTDSSRRAMRVEGAYRRSDLKLEATDGSRQFAIFVRQSIQFIENFTIGLRYLPQDGGDSITLYRCNGPHGPSNGSLSGSHHPHPHIHLATEQNLLEGARAEKGAVITTEYSEINGAISYFLGKTGFPVSEIRRCFPRSAQSPIVFGEATI